ncbi:hypothetical protein ACO1PK_00775 [Alishewanella sp. d11]|uniref:hypothetical protein n=1 Tax=Alishewanella sp. d11 TaxID=3414030 RepID=UPI003BF88736
MATPKAKKAEVATDPQDDLQPKTLPAIEILKDFSASENGAVVEEYKAGELYATLPAVAANYAISIGAVSDADAEKLKTHLAEAKPEAE